MGLAKRCSEFIQSPLTSRVNCAGFEIVKLILFPEMIGMTPLLEGKIFADRAPPSTVTETVAVPWISKETNAASPDWVIPGRASAAITVDFAMYTGAFCLSTVTKKRL